VVVILRLEGLIDAFTRFWGLLRIGHFHEVKFFFFFFFFFFWVFRFVCLFVRGEKGVIRFSIDAIGNIKMVNPPGVNFRPRKRSSVSFPSLPHHHKRSISFSRHGPSGSVSEEYEPKGSSSISDRAVTIIGIVVFFLLGVYILSGSVWNHQRYVPVKGDSPTMIVTNDPIITPKIQDIPLLKSNNVPKKAPNDKANNDKTDVHKLQPQPEKQERPVSSYVFKSSTKGSKSPRVVLVMGIDYEIYKPDVIKNIIENRIEYAKAHGYGLYVRYVQDFKQYYSTSNTGSSSWAKLMIARSALLAFPKAKYFWYLDQTALIMNPLVDIEAEFIDSKRLERDMQRDVPVIKTADYIKTYKFNRPENVRFVISQDTLGMNTASFIFHNDLYSVSLLEFWNDVMYREYHAFDKSEASALNHLVQWHPCYLSRMAVIPTRKLASFSPSSPAASADPEMAYSDGDFVVNFQCDPKLKTCTEEFQRFWEGRGHVKRSAKQG
jgi:mannan polymerase II complex MNN11 subunit